MTEKCSPNMMPQGFFRQGVPVPATLGACLGPNAQGPSPRSKPSDLSAVPPLFSQDEQRTPSVRAPPHLAYVTGMENATRHSKAGLSQLSAHYPQIAGMRDQACSRSSFLADSSAAAPPLPFSPPFQGGLLPPPASSLQLGRRARQGDDSASASPHGSPRSPPMLNGAGSLCTEGTSDCNASPTLGSRGTPASAAFDAFFSTLPSEERDTVARILFHAVLNTVASLPEKASAPGADGGGGAERDNISRLSPSGSAWGLLSGGTPVCMPGDSSPVAGGGAVLPSGRMLISRGDGSFRVATDEELPGVRTPKRKGSMAYHGSMKSVRSALGLQMQRALMRRSSLRSVGDVETDTDGEEEEGSQLEAYAPLELPPATSRPSCGDVGNEIASDDADADNPQFVSTVGITEVGDSPNPFDRADSPMLGGLGARHQYDSFLSIVSHNVVETDRVDKGEDTDGNKKINQYTVIGDLGRGSYAKVKLVIHDESDVPFALKIINKSLLKKVRKTGGTALEQARVELAIMKKIAHPRIVRLHEIIDDPSANKMYLIMDYVEGGVIAEISPEGTCETKPAKQVARYLRQIASALGHLHRHNIVHRDIKPSNILLDTHDNCFLCDFGVSSIITDTSCEVEGLEGTPYFFSPEMCEGNDVVNGKACDMWALGVTAYALLLGTVPFFAENRFEIMDRIQNDNVVIPSNTDPDIRSLLRAILNKSPKKRITLPELKVHPFVACRGERHPSLQYSEAIVISMKDMLNAFTLGTNVQARHEGGTSEPVSPTLAPAVEPCADSADEGHIRNANCVPEVSTAATPDLSPSGTPYLSAADGAWKSQALSVVSSLLSPKPRSATSSVQSRLSLGAQAEPLSAAAKGYVRRYVEMVRSRIVIKRSERAREKRALLKRQRDEERRIQPQAEAAFGDDRGDNLDKTVPHIPQMPGAQDHGPVPCVSIEAPASPHDTQDRWPRERVSSLCVPLGGTIPLTAEALRERDHGVRPHSTSVFSSLSHSNRQPSEADMCVASRRQIEKPKNLSEGEEADSEFFTLSPPVSLCPAPPSVMSPVGSADMSPRAACAQKRRSVFDVPTINTLQHSSPGSAGEDDVLLSPLFTRSCDPPEERSPKRRPSSGLSPRLPRLRPLEEKGRASLPCGSMTPSAPVTSPKWASLSQREAPSTARYHSLVPVTRCSSVSPPPSRSPTQLQPLILSPRSSSMTAASPPKTARAPPTQGL